MSESIRDKLSHLSELCPPPEKRFNRFSTAQWVLVGKLLGSRVPEQLIIFNELYGTGGFASRERPHTAEFHICTAELADCAIMRLAELREIKENHPSRVPCPLYFDKGGFFPIGAIHGGIDIGLMAVGTNSDQWKVALLRTGVRRLEITGLGTLDFLISMVEGTFVNEILPDAMRKKNSYAAWAYQRNPWPRGIGEVSSGA